MQAIYLRRTEGFTITEVIVAMAIFGFIILSIVAAKGTLQQVQRSARYNDIANAAARDIIETARNGQFDTLVAGQVYDRTSVVSDQLPGRSATLTVSSFAGVTNLKRVDVQVNYTAGLINKSVRMSAVIGKNGISQ